MTKLLSRRGILGGAMTGTAVLAGAGMAPRALAAEPCPKLQPGRMASLYGPDPADAHLVFNENPFGPSPKALQAIASASTQGAYYQGRSIQYLMDMIAETNGVSSDHVMISSGSYEALTAIAMAYASEGATLGPDLYWDTTARWAEDKGFSKIVRVPMGKDLEVDLDALAARVDDDIALVHIVNPNNPTGRLIPPAKLAKFIKDVSPKTTVLVDEAYIELSDDPEGNSMMEFVRRGENVIIARTFSKIYGMAGLRVGYTLAAPEILKKVQPYLVSSPNVAGIAAAIASYQDTEFLSMSKTRLVEARQMITEGVAAHGLKALPSQTSFVFVDTGASADAYQKKMAQKGILIRGAYGTYTPYSRVSCGYAEDVQRYLDAIPYALGA